MEGKMNRVRYYRVLGALAVAGLLAGAGIFAVRATAVADGAFEVPLEGACASAAAAEPSALRGAGKFTKMWCAVVDREGQTLAIKATDTGGTPSSPASSDAWRGSIEIALAKAYTAVAFSSNDQALDTLTLGLLTRTDGLGVPGKPKVGHDAGVAPLWGIGDSNPYRPVNGASLGGDDATGQYHHGIITFAGGQPVYDCGGSHNLLGAVGVSGDGVDQDNAVAKATVTGAGFCLAP
jgi:uncharacterized protein GlcG (DUF336 family)